MSVQLKFKDETSDERRREAVNALARAGFTAQNLFPGQKRPKLASIYTISEAGAGDIEQISAALADYGRDIEFVESAPGRQLKG
jgi:hypothetical protein